MIRTLYHTAIFGGVIAGLGIASAEAAPLLNPSSQPASEAAPLTLAQYYDRRGSDWYYGPKWGGYGSAYGYPYYYGPPAYGYYYGYGPAWRGYGPAYRGYGPRRVYREYPRWYYGPQWGGY